MRYKLSPALTVYVPVAALLLELEETLELELVLATLELEAGVLDDTLDELVLDDLLDVELLDFLELSDFWLDECDLAFFDVDVTVILSFG